MNALDASGTMSVGNVWGDDSRSHAISWTAFAAGFFFSFRAMLVMVAVRWLNVGTEPGVIAGLAVEFLLLLAIAFQNAGAPHSSGWMMCLPSVRWVLIFLAFSCASLLWSATVSKPASFLYWCGMAGDVMMVIALLRGRLVSEVVYSMMRGFIWSTSVLASIAWIMPASSDFRLGDEDYFNTNQIGNLCALAIFMAQFLVSRKVGHWKIPLWFLTITLLRSLSKATIIAFVVADGFLLLYDKSIGRKRKVVILCGAVLLLAAFWSLIGSYFDFYTTTGNQAETLTGRTAIWAYTLDASFEKPWIGNGIDAMWKVFPPFGREMFEARHAENELLQQFFAYGIAGVIILAGLYSSLWRGIVALEKNSSKAVLLAIMLFIVVRGLAEAEPFDLVLPLWMVTLISCIAGQARDLREPLRSAAIAAGSMAGSPAQ